MKSGMWKSYKNYKICITMFIGEIVAVYANEDCLENGRPNALKVKPTILMDTGYFDFNKMNVYKFLVMDALGLI